MTRLTRTLLPSLLLLGGCSPMSPTSVDAWLRRLSEAMARIKAGLPPHPGTQCRVWRGVRTETPVKPGETVVVPLREMTCVQPDVGNKPGEYVIDIEAPKGLRIVWVEGKEVPDGTLRITNPTDGVLRFGPVPPGILGADPSERGFFKPIGDPEPAQYLDRLDQIVEQRIAAGDPLLGRNPAWFRYVFRQMGVLRHMYGLPDEKLKGWLARQIGQSTGVSEANVRKAVEETFAAWLEVERLAKP